MTERDEQGWKSVEEEEERRDYSAPMHQPPAGGLPSYEAGGVRSTQKVELETSDWIAIVAALIPGVGQILLGQTVKGLVVLGVSLLLCVGGGLLSVASMIDAYLVATAKKRREVGDWEFFPDFQSTF